jgi:hypothetical protein
MPRSHKILNNFRIARKMERSEDRKTKQIHEYFIDPSNAWYKSCNINKLINR